MRVKVTLLNVLDYGLDVLTGNSVEDLLAKAAEMEAKGFDLYVNVPDVEGGDKDAPTERNIFEHYTPELPEPEGFSHIQETFDLRYQSSLDDDAKE